MGVTKVTWQYGIITMTRMFDRHISMHKLFVWLYILAFGGCTVWCKLWGKSKCCNRMDNANRHKYAYSVIHCAIHLLSNCVQHLLERVGGVAFSWCIMQAVIIFFAILFFVRHLGPTLICSKSFEWREWRVWDQAVCTAIAFELDL